MPLSRSKLALIHIAKAQLGMADDTYRALLRELANVDSGKELDETGFEAVIGHFEKLGFKTRRQQRSFGNRPGMATPEQVEFIRNLWKQYTGHEDETSLNHWLENKFRITALRFANRGAAHQALVALKAMVRRKK